MNHRDASVDVSVAHGCRRPSINTKGMEKTLSTPSLFRSGVITVSGLHFAEIFDDSAGRRLENIEINGQPVLKRLRHLY